MPQARAAGFVRTLGSVVFAVAVASPVAAAPAPAPAASAPAAPAPAASAPVSSTTSKPTGPKSQPPPSPDQPFNLPVAARTDAYGPRPPGVPELTRDQIVQYGLQNPLVKAADAQIEQMEATLLRAKFSWVPVIKTTTALAPGVYTRCQDIQLQTAGNGDAIDFQYCSPAGQDGTNIVDVDTIGGYFRQLKEAGIAVRFGADFIIPVFTSGKIKSGKEMAAAGVALARLNKERTRQETVLRVYQAHTALLLARESLAILDEAWKVVQEAKGQILVDLGESEDADPDESNPDRDPADLPRVELGELTLMERALEARKIEAIALATLWTIAGEAAPVGFDIAERALVTDTIEGGLRELPHYRELGAQQRPEAKMAAGLVELRKAGEKFARSQFLPDFGIAVSVQISYMSQADRDMKALYYFDRFNYNRVIFAFAMNWNLDFHNSYFGLKKARAERREAEHQREAARYLLGLEVEKAYRDLQHADRSVKLTEQATRKAKQLVVDQQVKQTVGGGNFAELEKALTRWAEWRFKQFEAIHAHNVALAALSRAVGTSLGASPSPTAASAPPNNISVPSSP
ncbi:Outer membrane protein TolC [Nannocystis exedens]|uniref:Outer membrane protein TolC n=1 Tax=Nannocystis exedens TaxID=54 RepID=A0A1I1ZNJ8_9BACT|nr:TolC family protein [Nannocystis exedens]SFE33261.1 Outer membrane protein TolC [Nannocystis exedens]